MENYKLIGTEISENIVVTFETIIYCNRMIIKFSKFSEIHLDKNIKQYIDSILYKHNMFEYGDDGGAPTGIIDIFDDDNLYSLECARDIYEALINIFYFKIK